MGGGTGKEEVKGEGDTLWKVLEATLIDSGSESPGLSGYQVNRRRVVQGVWLYLLGRGWERGVGGEGVLRAQAT